MPRIAAIASLLIAATFVDCREREASSAPSDALEDPSTCVDLPRHVVEPDPRAGYAVASAVTTLGECAANLAEPSPVLASVTLRKDGTVEHVRIIRTSTADCEAIACVRNKLLDFKAGPLPKSATVLIDFMLRREPPPDGNERIIWQPAFDNDKCTELAMGPDSGRRPEVLRGVVWKEMQTFVDCFEEGSRRQPRIHGRVATQFVIDERGAVTSANVLENEIADCSVVACIRNTFRTLTFPPSSSPTTVVYPLTFGQ